jgi:hypothetical protein
MSSKRPMGHWVMAAALAVPLVGCGGATTGREPAQAPHLQVASLETKTRTTDAKPVAAATDASSPAAETTPVSSGPERVVPTECAPGSQPCAAPSKFVDQVCRGKYADLALTMFAKGTPWPRGYLKVEKLEPVNIYDGERSEEWLAFGEEVLVLRTRGPGSRTGVQASGPTDVDILRWDGTCATIRQEMLARYPTNTSIGTARVVWKYLSTPMQDALLTSPLVKHASSKERPACRGSTMKSPDAACDKASRKLTEAISNVLRVGVVLPEPAKLPAWRD